MLKIYNTLTKKIEIFKPLKNKEVRMYNCGPTVYDYPHIGNYRAFVFADLLKRYLLWKGYKVIQVMNITDVDDKIIKKVNETGKKREEITSFYEKVFFDGLKELNCIPADFYPRATDHIEEIKKLIQKLIDKGYAYISNDGIYYRIKKFKNYGKLSGIKLKDLKIGARVSVQEYSKEQASDFALWKFWQPNDGNIYWEIELNINGEKKKIKGRPGWHIECSAMSITYLGESFDIHTGGIDLIFPHHENEIAQSEAATGKKFVKYWLHNAHLLVEGKKMSKSLGNYYTLEDLLKKGYKGYEIRYILISCNYREILNFRFSQLEAARKTINYIIQTISRLEEIKKGKKGGIKRLIDKTKKKFEKAMDNDLNIQKALSIFFSFINLINKKIDGKEITKKEGKKVINFIYDIDRILGIGFEKIYKERKNIEIPKEILELVKEREKARKEKNFKLADKIREKIKEKGWWIDDTPEGPKIKKLE